MGSIDWMELRGEFPVTRRYAYLNNAATSPVSERVYRAVSRFYRERMELAEAAWDRWVEASDDVRMLASKLLNVSPDEIALLKNTSDGLNTVAAGLKWPKGSRVVTTDLEFPSNLYPWLKLRERGVDVRVVKHRSGGTISIEDICHELDGARQGLVAISHVQYGNGFRIDLEVLRDAVGEDCRLCVDAIQSLGVNQVDARRVDFLSAGGHKWLLAPFGVALFYVKGNVPLEPPFVGWASVKDPEAYLPEMHLAETARRFEIGSLDFSSVYGLREALRLILEVGVRRIEEKTKLLVNLIEEGAEKMNLKKQSPREENRGSIIIIKVKEPKSVVSLLAQEKVMVAERIGGIRASPHFYNNEEDVARFLKALKLKAV